MNNQTIIEVESKDQDLCECDRCGDKFPYEELVVKSFGDEWFRYCENCADELFN